MLPMAGEKVTDNKTKAKIGMIKDTRLEQSFQIMNK